MAHIRPFFLTLAFCISDSALAELPERLRPFLESVSVVDAPGVPGSVCVFGEKAFSVISAKSGRHRVGVIAVSELEEGRVAAFGHTGYLMPQSLEKADTGRLMQNIVRWLNGKNPDKPVRVLGNPGLVKWMNENGLKAEPAPRDWVDLLSEYQTLYAGERDFSKKEQGAILEFIKAGGGFAMSTTGWGWLQLHPGKNLQIDHDGNRILAKAGLAFSDSFTQRTAPNGFETKSSPSEYLHAATALDALLSGKPPAADLDQISATALAASRVVPKDDEIVRPKLDQLLKSGTSDIPTAKKPFTLAKHARQRLALALQLQQLQRPVPEAKAHPAADAFPGKVPAEARRVERSLEIDLSIPNWHSTGLYAAPGELISFEKDTKAHLRVRIGCHKDRIWHKPAWRRVPEITTTAAFSRPSIEIASAFGGLVYILVPKAMEGKAPIKIKGAVEAPYFVLGKTGLEDWNTTIRNHPAPWAELACDSIIYSVPSSSIRDLEDPESLMKTWDEVMAAVADLATIPRKRRRPERFVLDVQISAGYMHSGYPIMAHLDAIYSMDRKKLLAGLWGNFHEIGHNHQSAPWTFNGTVEVTCNLFTLYVYEKVCGITPDKNQRTNPLQLQARITKYFADGAKFDRWKKQPFTALMMYVQLQQAFGWDSFKKVFKEYRTLKKNELPRTDDEERDQWMVRFSKTVGKNLGPFFQAWNVPTSEAARESIKELPAWMPEGFPPGK
ncbi:MAG: M60 family metallopeptidase [Planctomycetota bacterium]|jgi:hypothetical protein|nr:M60 family metallopeptidase [Planctomycetota bacterium]